MLTIEGSQITAILIPAPMVLVFGATIAVGIAGGTMKDFIIAIKALPGAFRGKTHNPEEVIDRVVSLAEKARSEGLLALEQEADDSDDTFLRSALQNIADGTDGEDLRILLEDEIETEAKLGRTAAKFFNAMGGYSPTIGIIGTVLGLVHVLENLSEPDKLGHLIAAAFIATLWGVLSANIMFLPWGKRIKYVATAEAARMELILDGVLAIQAGANPRVVQTKLRSKMPAEGPAAAAKEAA